LIKIVITRNSFDYLSIIGRGGFGKVWKVCHKQTRILYAMKEMNKSKIIDKKSDKSVKSERDLLSKLNHPFIINMHFSFQDSDNLYLVMDLLTGGDLRYHICKTRYFTEEQSKFFISCILLGLEYCHYYHIIHRDIKPENLILDSKGYVHITDFGIAKIQTTNNNKETSGTPGYMSPEVLCGQNHTTVVDYFALGVMGYEFMMGIRPYLGTNRKEIKEKVMAKQAVIHRKDIKKGWGVEAADFINRMLQRKPGKRLGAHGITEVKNHIWFKNYNWNDLYNKKLIAPFIPSNEDNFDYKYCNNVEKQGLKTKERYAEIVISDNYKTIFNSYLYFNRNDLKNKKDENGDKYYIYPNIHEKMYISLNPHQRNKSVATDFSNYRKFSNKNRFNINGGEINNDLLINHGRAFSSIGIAQNKAFLEANNYLNYHKKKKLAIGNNNKFIVETNKNKKNGLIKIKLNTNTNIINTIKTNNTNTNNNIFNKTNFTNNNTNNTNSNKKNKLRIFMHVNHNRSKNKSTINGIGIVPLKEKENYNYNSIRTDKNYYINEKK
jgi:serum/glucocorticoid-regulated kinase 2